MKFILGIMMLFLPLIFTAQISLNELSAKGGVVNMGGDEDWLEIINTGAESLFLADYYLSDNADDLQKWNMPAYTLTPGEILLVLASGNNVGSGSGVWQSFVLAENTWKYLPGTTEPSLDWNSLDFNDSAWQEASGGFGYADEDDGTELEGFPSVYIRRTFQVSDASAISEMILHADYDDAFVAYLNGTEIARSSNIEGFPPAYDSYATIDHEANLYEGGIPEMYTLSPAEIDVLVQNGDNVLAIQTHNVSAESSDMSSNFFLSGLLDSFNPSYLPLPTWYQPFVNSSFFETNFKLSPGETVFATSVFGDITDSVTIPEDLTGGLSYGREPDGTGPWCYFDVSSPAVANANSWCYAGIAEEPTVSLPSGWYTSDQLLTVDAQFNAVRFTSNGDAPTLDSPLFIEAEVDENISYSFRSFSQQNLLPSVVVDRTYILDEDNYELPVFSIHTDEAHLWDWEDGIYVYGPNADLDNYPYFGSNFWEPWSRFSRVEFFNGNKELKAEEYLDLEIHGGWSRGESQKSFRFDFKSAYTGNLEESLFSQKPFIEDVNNINLRAGGQHLWTDKIQDGLFSRVVNDLNLDNMAYEPCLLYLNGEFWGVYAMREKMDEHYAESNHDVNSSEVDLLNSWGVLEGTDAHFIETFEVLMQASSNLSEFYQVADSRLDLENYMDYFIAETYLQNKDWMGIEWGLNNVKLWRPQTEGGKWRYMMYDLDFGFSFLWGSVEDNFIAKAKNPPYPSMHSELFNKLLTNNQFKCEFAQRYADVINTVFQPSYFTEKKDEIVSQMEGAMTIHADRWAENVPVEQWYVDVNQIANYNTSRIPTARAHVNDELNLGGQTVMTFNVLPEGAGTIQVNTIEPESFPWTGVYFHGCPVQIIATPNEGFVFDSWNANGIITEGSGESVLLENLFQNDTFTANFFTEGVDVTEIETVVNLEVFPNPTNGFTTLSYESSIVEDVQIAVYDMAGKQVFYEQVMKGNRELIFPIDLTFYEKGMYLVELKSDFNIISTRVALQ